MIARAAKKVREILASHYPNHVSEAVDAAIRARFPVRLPRAGMLPGGGGAPGARIVDLQGKRA